MVTQSLDGRRFGTEGLGRWGVEGNWSGLIETSFSRIGISNDLSGDKIVRKH